MLNALRDAPEKPEKRLEPAPDDDAELSVPKALRCRSCGAVVSNAKQIFGPGGLPARQMFANPAGRVFEVLTVREAVSVEAWGEPTTEHTWFSGYAWRALVCGACVVHLGWRFDAVSGADPPHFFGLVTAEIVEEG